MIAGPTWRPLSCLQFQVESRNFQFYPSLPSQVFFVWLAKKKKAKDVISVNTVCHCFVTHELFNSVMSE